MAENIKRLRQPRKAIGDLNLNITTGPAVNVPQNEAEPENEAFRDIEQLLKQIENAEGASWQLERLSPVSYQGIPTRGYIGQIPYNGGLPSFNEIKQLHGGGKYLLMLRDSAGKFIKNAKIIKELIGPPNLAELTEAQKPQVEAAQLPARSNLPETGLIALFQMQMTAMQEQSKQMQSMMIESIKSGNAQLMQLIQTFAPLFMQNKGPDIAAYLEKAADLLDAAGGLDGIRGLLGNNSGADSPVQQLAAVAASFLESKIDKKNNPIENKALSEVTELPEGLEEVK